jgi:hypothetical protein
MENDPGVRVLKMPCAQIATQFAHIVKHRSNGLKRQSDAQLTGGTWRVGLTVRSVIRSPKKRPQLG